MGNSPWEYGGEFVPSSQQVKGHGQDSMERWLIRLLGHCLDISLPPSHRPPGQGLWAIGLTNNLSREVIGYERSVAKIYAKSTFELIAHTGNLDVLSHVIPAASNTRRRPAQLARVENDLPT